MNFLLQQRINKIILALVACVGVLTLQSAQKVTIGGAGVLPYAINPKNNALYFLLGKEKGGKFQGTWGDFGGGADIKKDHNDPVATATREFYEESERLFGGFGDIQKLMRRRQVLSE